MVPMVGGVVGKSAGDGEIIEDLGFGEGNNSFGRHGVRVMFLFWNLNV